MKEVAVVIGRLAYRGFWGAYNILFPDSDVDNTHTYSVKIHWAVIYTFMFCDI